MALHPTYIIEEKSSILHTEREIICSILFGRSYISYVFSNPERTAIYLVKHFDLQNQVLGKSDFDEMLFDLFIKKALSVRLAIDSQKVSLMPSKHSKKLGPDFFATLFEQWPEEAVYQQNASADCQLFYSLKKKTVEFLQQRIQDLILVDSTLPLLKIYPEYCNRDCPVNLFIAVKEEHFYLTVLNEDSSFSLHQSHPYQQAEDVLFSVAQVIFNMQAQADSVGIQIHGEVSSTDSVIELLRSYYPGTRPMRRIKSLQYPEELFQHPSYYFFNLFALVSCEL
ncbi:MAG: DUF3822 family protein [Chitinophagaceae bacterium]|nr:DUF3822 family protein [Chitinophagaceae bacterium]